MNAWTTDLPKTPGHYWVRVPGFEREPDVEHIEDLGQGLVVRDDKHGGEWRPLADVWGESGASWWGPLLPISPLPVFHCQCQS